MSTITDKSQTPIVRPIRRRSEWLNTYLKPQEPIPRQIYFAAMVITVLQLVLLVADVAAHVPHDLLDSAYTLGAKRRHALTAVLIPATLPGVMDNLRITIGWAWTYLVVAELVAAEQGLGYMILDSMRGLF